jgi:hypothetical protein
VAKRGRPTQEATPGTKVSLGLTVTADLKARLDEEAQRTGRTQSQEAQWRLELSFDRQDLLNEVLTLAYGPQTAALLSVLGHAVSMIERRNDKQDGLATPKGYTDAATAIDTIVKALNPGGRGFPPKIEPLAKLDASNWGQICASGAIQAIRSATGSHWDTVRQNLGEMAERWGGLARKKN